jgi:hypothetical protein
MLDMAGQQETDEQELPNKAMATIVALAFALSVLAAFGAATWVAYDGRDDTHSEETHEEETDTHDEAG